MEAFESFVALALEDEGLVVSAAVKFKVRKQTAKVASIEFQEHGYEVDLIGCRSDRLVLATVKSFFGSSGVQATDVLGTGRNQKGYKLLNNLEVRDGVLAAACERYGYRPEQVEFRLYVGKFGGGKHEVQIRDWCANQIVGGHPIGVFGVLEIVDILQGLAKSKTYLNNPALVALKVLDAAAEARTKLTKQSATSDRPA